ncbi:MAG TPA: hypothetical protein VFD28_01315 [Candidatus Eisenbacteria bacterium]|nr:hypothetical protein [Candidatus Eisenbacteria bacterium]
MDKIKDIIDIILSEAEEQAEQVLLKADAEIAQNSSEVENEIMRLQMVTDERISSEKDSIAMRTESILESRTRQIRLQQKQDVISKVIKLALKKFAAYPDDKKIEFYKKLITSRNIHAGEISLNQAEQKLVDQLLAELGSEFTAGDVADIEAGLIVTHNKIEENLSFDLVIRDKRSELSALAASELFAN